MQISPTTMTVKAKLPVDKSKRSINALENLRKTYFPDKRELYLVPDIYQHCLKCCIETIIMTEIAIALSGNHIKHNLNFAVLTDFIRTENTHIIVHLRQLLGKGEGKSGAGLLEAIRSINYEQYLEFFTSKSMLPGSLLLHTLRSNHSTSTLHPEQQLIAEHKNEINNQLRNIRKKINKFKEENYHHRLIKEFEALELHNDSKANKYSVSRQATGGEIIKQIVTRTRRSAFNIKGITECLDSYASIMQLAITLSIVPNKFGTSHAPVEDYANVLMQMFKISDNDLKSYLLDEIKKNLADALRLTQWPVNSYAK